MLRVIVAALAALMLCSCATYFKEPGSGSPRALISGKQSKCLFDCKAGVFIRAVDGVEVSNNWKTNNYYVGPGRRRILVAVNDVGLFGVCMLEIDAVADEEYTIADVVDGQTFVVTAYDKSGAPVSSCVAPMGPPPVGSTYVPIIIPVR